MQQLKFNHKYLGGVFRGIRQDGDKTSKDNQPVMVLLIQTEQITEKLGLEQKSTVIEVVRVPQFLVEKGALHDFADYLELPILVPITERPWEMKGRSGDILRGNTLSLGKDYKQFLSLTQLRPVANQPGATPVTK